jgi:hypothetical protein
MGSTPAFGFEYLLGGLQYDSDLTLTDGEYLGWFKLAGRAELASASKEDVPAIRLLLAYAHYLSQEFAAASAELAAVKADETVKDNNLIETYVTRLSACVVAKDPRLCPAGERVIPRER